jgi:predicted DNA-binding transcriptional regulator AlpA
VSEGPLRARDVAERLSISTESVLRWHRSGRLPGGYRLATGVLRWREDEVDAWVEGRREVVCDAREA